LNQQLDPQKGRFKLAQLPDGRPATFNLDLKPEIIYTPSSGKLTNSLLNREIAGPSSADFTTKIAPNGQLGIIEFTGALPRASLIPSWQVDTNNAETLQILASPTFDPQHTVLVADSLPAPPPPGPSPGTGTVTITDYAPKRMELAADVNAPCVLLLSDRYNPKWKVTVDGTPDRVLRCNSVERGVYLTSGKHDVVFSFSGDYTTFLISLGAAAFGLLLCGWLALTKEPERTEPANPARLRDRTSVKTRNGHKEAIAEKSRKKLDIIDVEVVPGQESQKKKPKKG
jgi:hypothetical protein